MYTNRQRGTSLIEALIATILIAMVGSGAIHLTTRATTTYTDQQLLSMAITQMRAAISADDVCVNAPIIQLPDNISLTAEVQGCDTTSATIDGTLVEHIPTPIGLSVESDFLGGQVVVGGTWRH